MQLGVYCETLSPDMLREPDVLKLLGEYGVTLGHALRFTEEDGRFDPDRLAPHLELAAALREAGGRYCLWPLLPKPMGYWINERNLDAADRMADALLEGCRRFGAAPDLYVMDVETPWQQMEEAVFPGPPAWRRVISFIKLALTNRSPIRFSWSVKKLTGIVERLRAESAPVIATVFELLVIDLINEGHALQDYLEMPIFPVPFDAYNAMFYNSYIPVAAPMLIQPDSAARALFEYGSVLIERFREKAWITLGSTWEGVLPGNEGGIYTRAEQLAPDVGAAKAAGFGTIWLYCLEGVLFADQKLTQKRPAREARSWFEVIRRTEAKRPPHHPKWSRSRAIMERLLKDRFKHSYAWVGK